MRQVFYRISSLEGEVISKRLESSHGVWKGGGMIAVRVLFFFVDFIWEIHCIVKLLSLNMRAHPFQT